MFSKPLLKKPYSEKSSFSDINVNSALISVVTIVLSLLGLLFIYSASSYSAGVELGDSFFYVKKQAIALAAGLIFMFFLSKFPLEKLKKLSLPILIVSYVLLALVFVPFLGEESYGATRWINLGIFSFQPSEFAKFGLVIFMASYLSKHKRTELKYNLPVLFSGLLMCGLIILEPNMSITICVFTVTVIMMFIGGTKGRFFIIFGIFAIIAAVGLILAEPYRLARISAFMNPWESPLEEGYQLIQSYYALGAGGLTGLGLFNSRQKFLFLPFAESDFIFSIIVEETGALGGMAVIALFGVLIYIGLKIAKQAKDRFSCLLGTGVVAVIAVQTLINMAVVTGTIPPTGLPLPFVSAGGTSLIAFMGGSGLLMNISKN